MQGSGSMRGWTAAVGAAAVLAGLVLVATPDRAPAPPVAGRDGGAAGRPDLPWRQAEHLAERGARIDTLLASRAEAIRSHDEAAFLASLDPQASPAFLREQRELFANLTAVPFTHWSYEVDPYDTVSVPADSGPADDLWAPKVVLRYAIAKADVVPTTRPMGYLFARRGDSWYVTADEFHDSGRRTWRGPWGFGAVDAVSTRHGVVLAHPGTRELADRVARKLDASVAAVTEVWGHDWPRQVGVLLPDGQRELQSAVGPQFAVDGIAAVAVADRVDTARGVVEGPRVVLNPSTARSLSDAALRVVLQHEITHIAARGNTADGSPMWLLEGFADYVGYRDSGIPPREIAPDLVRQVHEVGPPEELPSDRDFHLAGQRLDLAYQQAWSLVTFLVAEVGEQRVVELYHRIAGAGSHAAVSGALKDLTGMDTPEVIARWSDSLVHSLR